MAHWADGRWNTITGLVSQLIEKSVTHANDAVTTQLTFTPPTTEKYDPLTAAQKKNRRYRIHCYCLVMTAGVGSNTQSMSITASWTDPFGILRTDYSSNTLLTVRGNRVTKTFEVWLSPGDTVTVQTSFNNALSPTTRAVVDLNIVVEAM